MGRVYLCLGQNAELPDYFEKAKVHIWNIEELCYFIQSVLALTEIDIYSYDYKKSFKYLIYSLKQGYHLNITKLEIQNYCIQISRLVNEGWNV